MTKSQRKRKREAVKNGGVCPSCKEQLTLSGSCPRACDKKRGS